MIDWTADLHPLKLAAVIYRPADDVDGLLATFASDLICEGYRIGGIVQKNVKGACGPRALMEVVDLMNGDAIRICQSLGSGAEACRLNPAGLAEAATAVGRGVAAKVDLVVVNKFSKQEAAGGGVRAEIAAAVTAGVPLLTAVPDKCYDAWTKFTGAFGTTLLCERRIIEDWWREVSLREKRPRMAARFRDNRCHSQQRESVQPCADRHLPIITSDDLITADTLSPTLRARSSTASLVMDDVTIRPGASSILT
jgi:molybdate transport system ATP-binding protein